VKQNKQPHLEDLRKWFGKGKEGGAGGGGWDRYNTSGDRIGKCGDAPEGSAYSACLSKEKAKKLGKDGRASFVRRKRAAQKKAGDTKKGEGEKGETKTSKSPTYVKTGVQDKDPKKKGIQDQTDLKYKGKEMKSHLDKAKAKLTDRYGSLSDVDYPKAVKVVGSTMAARLAARGMIKRSSGETKKGELGKNEGLRQAMSGPRETPAQKRKRKEKDNFDLYKKRQKRAAALRGDPSSRKLTRGQEKHYQQTVNLRGIRGESFVRFRNFKVNEDCGCDEPVIMEAEYQGRKVKLNDPIRTSEVPTKKFKVYVQDGDKVKVVRFGDPNMEIKRDDPERIKNFRARHNCDNPGPKTKARYWSCFQWRRGAKVDN